ncbi:leucokinin [Musca domestica]|uniref:Leucokinin n=1 Tax=Musca domestica TaxID=7370 RepID=A0A1I8N8J3_MUSDO|nr:leucokinin [Musca domestica]XP_011290460.1 leucokinin [Musca domestica]XP_019890586.1 leucokinin [Musca domestica]
MYFVRVSILVVFLCFYYCHARAEIRDLQTCESHLNKYRRFLLQAILNFEDICDAYNPRVVLAADNGLPPQMAFLGHYQPTEQKAETWTFLKLLMAQFNDMDFGNILRDAIIDRCHLKFQQQQQQQLIQQQQQRDEKRNTVVLGKKQRFHSWGGKRSGGLVTNDLDMEHNVDDVTMAY